MSEADDPNEEHWARLARYLAGEGSAAERREVEHWAAAESRHRKELVNLRRLWEHSGALPSQSRIDGMWQALSRQLDEVGEHSCAEAPEVATPARSRPVLRLLQRRRPRMRSLRHRVRGAIAAMLVLAAGSAVLWRTHRTSAAGMGADADSIREYATGRGQRARIRLADGTGVELGVESRLRVPRFRDGSRELYLEGEAAFDVVHDEHRPFVVRSGNTVTEDLGTRFWVRHYPDEARVRVVVVEGSVALRSTTAPRHSGVVLHAGQLGELDAAGRTEVTSGVDTASFLAWTEGRLRFRDAPLRDVATELGRWYDVQIVIPDSTLGGRRITLDMPVGGLDEVLNAVAVPLGVRYERVGQTVLLRP